MLSLGSVSEWFEDNITEDCLDFGAVVAGTLLFVEFASGSGLIWQ